MSTQRSNRRRHTSLPAVVTGRPRHVPPGGGLALAAIVVAGLGGCSSTGAPASSGAVTPATTAAATRTSTAPAAPASPRRRRTAHREDKGPGAVGLRVLHLVDRTRLIGLPGGGRVPRTLITLVRYPAAGSARALDIAGAPPLRRGGGFPLIVFGHGYAVTPAPYSRLLQSWTQAGYVVAAPVFPLENARAPGGPNENDLVNQPADMSFVISQVLHAATVSSGFLAGLVNPLEVAVSGQSDGGDTALAAAYDPVVRDRRVGAAVILSGAEDPFSAAFRPSASGPPLLATQGTADTINPPAQTDAFFRRAPRPRYLLSLLGASHQPPYTQPGAQLDAVEQVSIAFLDRYLKSKPRTLARLVSRGTAGSATRLLAQP